MGFPEGEVRHALAAARGNADLAVEFLMSGLPLQDLANSLPPSQAPAPAAGADTGPLAQLRLHPQFTQLQGLVQSNPASLTQVLEAIGQQDAALLAAIHANRDAFVAMMNEPIAQAPAPAPYGGYISHFHPCYVKFAFRVQLMLPSLLSPRSSSEYSGRVWLAWHGWFGSYAASTAAASSA